MTKAIAPAPAPIISTLNATNIGNSNTTATTITGAPNSTSSVSPEIPATVKEIQPNIEPSSLLFAQIPEIDEDSGYLVPSNFAPINPIPLNDDAIGQSQIL